MLTSRLIIKGISIVSTIILAKILTPDDFGLVAIAMSVYGFIELFGAFGFPTVLIQKTDPSEDDYSTAWTINFIFHLLTATFLVTCASQLASYFSDPRLIEIFYIIALMSIVSGCKNIAVINLQKHLDFKRELYYQIIPKILSFIITIYLCITTRNYYALIFGSLSHQVIGLVMGYILIPRKPYFTLASYNSIFNFSKWLMLSNLIFYINNQLSNLIIGKHLDSSSVGKFAISNEIATLPMTEITASINKASFPVYSKLKSESDLLKSAFLKTQNMISTVAMPVCIGIFIVAEHIVNILLNESWAGVADIMRALSVSSAIALLATNYGYLFTAQGKPHVSTALGAVRAVSLVGLIFLTIDAYSISGIGYAYIASSAIFLICNLWFLNKTTEINIFDVLKSINRPIIASLAMVAFSAAIFNNPDFSILELCAIIAANVVVYTLSVLSLWKLQGSPNSIEEEVIKRCRNIKISQFP